MKIPPKATATHSDVNTDTLTQYLAQIKIKLINYQNSPPDRTDDLYGWETLRFTSKAELPLSNQNRSEKMREL